MTPKVERIEKDGLTTTTKVAPPFPTAPRLAAWSRSLSKRIASHAESSNLEALYPLALQYLRGTGVANKRMESKQKKREQERSNKRWRRVALG